MDRDRIRPRLQTVTVCALLVFGAAATASAQPQAGGRAAANQLHAAIVNGDVESLRYWLDVRHADPTAASDAEPDLTPIARCVGMAARVLDAPSGDEHTAPAVGLRVLQDMVLLLREHDARLSESDRQRFSNPVLRWYDDAVSPARPAEKTQSSSAPEAAPPSSSSANPPGDPKRRSADTGSAVALLTKDTAVAVTSGRRRCNGAGHLVYVTNHNALPITATLEIVEDAAGASPTRRTEDITIGPENTWELGCDSSKAGKPVSYVLKGWR